MDHRWSMETDCRDAPGTPFVEAEPLRGAVSGRQAKTTVSRCPVPMR